jgi:hypothetical protein
MTEDDREVLAELTTLANDLLEQATAVRRQWSELGEALGVELPDGPDPAAIAAVTGAPVSREGEERVAQPEEEDPVRLVALDMLLSGRSREDIERYLRQTFGDDYRPEVLDEVFDEYR